MTMRIAQTVSTLPQQRLQPHVCAFDQASLLFSCLSGARAGECQANPAYMMESCKKSCGACRDGPKETRRSGQRASSTRSSTGSRGGSRGAGGDASTRRAPGELRISPLPRSTSSVMVRMRCTLVKLRARTSHTRHRWISRLQAWCDARRATRAASLPSRSLATADGAQTWFSPRGTFSHQ